MTSSLGSINLLKQFTDLTEKCFTYQITTGLLQNDIIQEQPDKRDA